MSKSDSEDVDQAQVDQKDEPTAKFLHKLAENGKERGCPESVTAFYEKKAWEASKSEEKYQGCEKCHMPPPPEFAEKIAPSKECRNCLEINKKTIGLVSEIQKSEEIVKKSEQKSLKRPIGAVERSEPEPMKIKTMPRKVARQSVARGIIPPYQSPKSRKKAKIVEKEDPEFLQKLFGIGAKKM